MLRLTSTNDYGRLRQSPNKVVGKYFIVVFLNDSNLSECIAGITVSKKVGNAAKRNRVKRRVKAFLRDFNPPDSKQAIMANIIALPLVIEAEWLALCRDLENCFLKILKSI